MAGEQNLKPIRSKEEARERGKKGGRRKRTMKQTLEMIATLPFNIKDKNGNSIKEQLKALGINEGDIDYEMAMNYSLFLTAIKGGKNQVSAATFVRDTLGDKPIDKVEVTKDTDETITELEKYIHRNKNKEVGISE